EAGAGRGSAGVGGKGAPALGGRRPERRPGGRAPGALGLPPAPPRDFRVGVVQDDVVAVEEEPRRPAAADHAAAEQTDRANAHARVRSRSFSRTSAAPSRRTFIAWRIVTARATSSAFVARRPRER